MEIYSYTVEIWYSSTKSLLFVAGSFSFSQLIWSFNTVIRKGSNVYILRFLLNFLRKQCKEI